MKSLSFLIKPASSLCNMRCRYCFYSSISSAREIPSYGIMQNETAEKIIDNIFRDINATDQITFGFQGGEPSLAGVEWFRSFVQKVLLHKKAKISWTFQTNGLLMDQKWCDFFLENKFLVGLSIDAGKRLHDRNRISAADDGTFEACLQTKELFDKNRVEYNVLCVLTNELAKEPDRAWRFIKNENIRFIQFIPCLDAGDLSQHSSPNTLRPPFFAQFYSRLLRQWIKELENGNYISIKFFDDVANYFYKGIPTSCGIDGQCQNQYVIEADGSVYPCDFYAFDQFKIGSLCESTPKEIFESKKTQQFLLSKQQLPEICNSCAFLKSCRSGCKRMHNVMYTFAGSCGYKTFLEKSLKPLLQAVQALQKKLS